MNACTTIWKVHITAQKEHDAVRSELGQEVVESLQTITSMYGNDDATKSIMAAVIFDLQFQHNKLTKEKIYHNAVQTINC